MKTNVFLALILSVFFFGNLQAQTKADEQGTWTPAGMMKYRNITDTDISPDGKYIAYVVRDAVMEGEKSEYSSQIWITATDGGLNVQYTRGEKSAMAPQFSPDGQKVAFLSNRQGDKMQVFMMRLLGGEAEQITKEKQGVSSFKWSPDGTKIGLVIRDKDTEEEEKQKKEKRDVILVDQNYKYNHIYTVDISKKEYPVKRITKGAFHVNSIDWSPDNSTIVFSHSPNPTINSGFIESDISIVPADSGAVKALVTRPGIDANPKFSPDGKTIAFQTHGGKPEAVGLSDINVVAVAGGTPQKLIQTPDRNANLLGWNIDGKEVFVSETNRTSQTMFAVPTSPTIALENKVKVVNSPLTSTEGNAASFSFSTNGKMAYVYEKLNTPEEVYVVNRSGGESKAVSNVNADYKAGEYAQSEVIQWKSKDGMEIEGILTYPKGYEKGKKYPVILQIHGGPAGVFTKNYTGKPSIYMTQLFAEKGYVVLRPNPRGSEGYGKDFRYANVKDWGYGDYQDIITGVDDLIKKGIADKDRQFVMGWSYGGYMTSWVVTQTNRFKAASMGAGLPNLISMTTTTDISNYLVAHMGGKNFWEDYEEYEKHSAIYQFKNVVTPTQVIHGANDLRVPFTQGQEFYEALKMKGIPTEMIVYPRTPHGPTEPKLLMDVSPRILTWFKKFDTKK